MNTNQTTNPLYGFDSSIFFDVAREEFKGCHSDVLSNDKVMLTRLNKTGNNEPSYLSTVGRKYSVVTNRQILEPLQDQMKNYFQGEVLEEVTVKDTLIRNGAISFREYIFPRINNQIVTGTGHETKLGLRYVLKNTFDGSASITFYSGCIDFFCTNGIIRGEYDITKRRHSVNFNVDGFILVFKDSLDKFKITADTYQKYADTKVSNKDVKKLFDLFTNVKDDAKATRRESLSDKLFSQYLVEADIRGNNMFSVVSSLTNYSSHASGKFALTKAGNDNTMLKRQDNVVKWLSSKTWQDFQDHNYSLAA